MKKTKIDWCDCTLNPVVGCKNNCEYCYARKQNDRFHFVPCWREPQFFPERLKQLNSKKSKSVFMDSMSDVGFWKEDWIQETIKAMQKNRQHRYIFLSKCQHGFLGNDKFYLGLDDIAFFGLSVTTARDWEKLYGTHFDFISIEPLLEDIKLHRFIYFPSSVKLIIVGAETGNRKEKVVPKKEWVDSIVKFADEHNIKVFMKSSLKEIMGKDFRQDKLLWDTKTIKEE